MFVVSDKLEEMEEGKDRSTIEEAASDFQECAEYIPSDEQDDSIEYQWMAEEMGKDALVLNESKEATGNRGSQSR